MRFCEAGHPEAQVRECGDQLVQDQRRSLHGQRNHTRSSRSLCYVCRCSIHTCGESPYPRRLFYRWRKYPSSFFSASVRKFNGFALRHKPQLIVLLVFPSIIPGLTMSLSSFLDVKFLQWVYPHFLEKQIIGGKQSMGSQRVRHDWATE